MSRFCVNCSVPLVSRGGAARSTGFWAMAGKTRKVKIIDALNEVFYRRTKSLALTEEERLAECRRSLCHLCATALGNLHHHFIAFKNRSVENSFVMLNYINAILNVTQSLPEPDKVDAETQTKWTWTQKKLVAASEMQTESASTESIGPSSRQPGQWLLTCDNNDNKGPGSKSKEKRLAGLPRRAHWLTSSESLSHLTESQTYPWVQLSGNDDSNSFLEHGLDDEPEVETTFGIENSASNTCSSVDVKFELEDHNYTNRSIPDPDELSLAASTVEQKRNAGPNNTEEDAQDRVRIETPSINTILPSHVPRETLCPVCSFDVRFPKYLLPHLLTRHRPRIRKLKPKIERERICPDCGEVFFKSSTYQTHVKWNKKHGTCNRAIFSCSYPNCGRIFRAEYVLKSHLRVHDTRKTIECSHSGCTKKFRTKAQMKQHVLNHESRTFVCEECGAVLNTHSGLYRHVRHVHRFPRKKISPTEKLNLKRVEKGELESVRPFSCTVVGCGQKFLKREYMTRHIRSHNYICKQCPYISFTSPKRLRLHLSRTHSVCFENNVVSENLNLN